MKIFLNYSIGILMMISFLAMLNALGATFADVVSTTTIWWSLGVFAVSLLLALGGIRIVIKFFPSESK